MTDNPWKDRTVFITGVCGTVGKELVAQILAQGVREIVGIDNNESEVFFLGEQYRDRPEVRLFVGDVRDRDTLYRKMNGTEVVIHAAALKHVILCEHTPRDAVLTNILGSQHVIDAALANGVQRVVFTSSDKAVNSTNVMGTSKLMGERLFTAANAMNRGDGPVFSSTRFGNVLGSRGSVIPLFKKQIAGGGPVTVTDFAMTRFIMTLQEAVRLVMESVFLANGGEVFVTKMPVVRIQHLAEIMVEELAPRFGHKPEAIEIREVGSRPGEKLYEELMTDEETRRTVEIERHYVVLPAFKYVYANIDYTYAGQVQGREVKAYNSAVEAPMEREELRAYLLQNHLLDLDE